ncbi:putative DIE2/ALG10 family-domain-containing protein [Seiridium cardinale]|uniref:Dol-P-Glc:Glc(2)Man(9)GlcNAc(2)-PP-Dol alpha-1,2-glucosyltransferase n=1 Tax=Seiridium cardinale TaxID=138064 RepID=A0ABR2XY98_9PEZI
MSTISEKIGILLTPTILRAVAATAILGFALCTAPDRTHPGHSRWQWFTRSARNYALPIAIPAVLGCVWLTSVNVFVPEPYMDEFFHIPQAQVYCKGRYTQWDDKITTPPGLYVLSIIWARISGYEDCSVETLRRFNVFVTALTAVVASACRAAFEGPTSGGQSNSMYSIHTGINIALFPVLFFFSGLYYTDVISTCVVLLAYQNHLVRLKRSTNGHSYLNDLYTVFLAVLSLFMRQTNVFWVVVYMGGLEAIRAIRDIPVTYEAPVLDTWTKQAKFFVWKSSIGAIHDPLLQNAWPDDLVLCLLSIGIAALSNIGTVLRRIYPHVIVVGLFAGFVAWNGGVVLGDKTNHVATIHLAQMLYIWPLFAFFSVPLFAPQVLQLSKTLQRYACLQSTSKLPRSAEKPKQDSRAKINYLGVAFSVILFLCGLVAAVFIIRYNTIIHPFTLADNRHYMFYVFRYTIMRGSVIRLLLAPVYIFCATLVWTSLYQLEPKVSPITADPKVGSSTTGVLSSQIMILLFTTALSLMTAPLVEPRYFILPWVFWRLMVPRRTGGRQEGWDWTLVLETGWFLVVNALLMYIFLTRPFVWKMEDGRVLDGGNVQRFMW